MRAVFRELLMEVVRDVAADVIDRLIHSICVGLVVQFLVRRADFGSVVVFVAFLAATVAAYAALTWAFDASAKASTKPSV